MKGLFLAAVDFELSSAKAACSLPGNAFVCGGMGPEATRHALEEALATGPYDLVVNIGVAGSYHPDRYPDGCVVQVVREQYGGRGTPPILNPAPPRWFAALPQVSGNTVPALETRYRTVDADIETMEGAAFFETCLAAGVPFAEIRAVSNRVGEEDRSLWNIPLALRNLEEALRRFVILNTLSF